MNQNSRVVYAVTVNWNRPEDTCACVESLLSQERAIAKIVIVDNGSTDDSVSILRSKFPQIELIASPTNLKFGGGFNLGMRHALEAGAESIFIINNDAVIAPDGLASLLQQSDAEAGVVAPFIYYFDQPDRIWSIGGKIRPWTLEVTHEGRNMIDKGEWPPVLEQDFVTGCSMLFSRKVLEEVGLFDETFRHYYEDMDLCRRIRQAGYRILVVPQAKVWHKVAASSGGTDTPDERYWMARSSVRYFRKHAKSGRLLVIIPYRFGSAIRTSLRLTGKNRPAAVRAYWQGLMDGLRDTIQLPMK